MTLHRFLRAPLDLLPPGMRLRVLSGPLRGARWINGAATHGCWVGTYERDTQRVFCSFIRRGDVVFDVGANVGFFTLLASKLVGPSGRVFAFEPLPRNLELLREHLRLNGAGNVTVLPVALSSEPGRMRFSSGASPSMGHLSDSGTIEVSVATLDQLYRSGEIARPGFIKMDVEGAEHAALTGGSSLLRHSPLTLLLSEHGWAQHDLCTTLLRTHGYDLQLLRDGDTDGNYVVLAHSTEVSTRIEGSTRSVAHSDLQYPPSPSL